MERIEQNPVAGWARVVLAAFAAALTPWLLPNLNTYWPVLGGYVVIALVLQLLIGRRIGGRQRAFWGGVVDLCIVTYLVHLTGSMTSVLVCLYLVVGILEAIVAGGRVARGLGVVAVLMYDGLLVLEHLGLVSYGPEAPAWAPAAEPEIRAVMTSALYFTVIMGTTTWIVARVADRLGEREQQLIEANRALNDQSQRDPLTGLFNRRTLYEVLERELSRVERGHPLALLMLDLDGFKRVNDTRGHVAGDELLQSIAAAVVSSVRSIDLVVRYGGDEFVVLLPDTEEQAATAVADRVVDAIARVGAAVDDEEAVTASVGVGVATQADSPRELIARADELAYVAKQAGGNRLASGRVRAA
ncbi:MAG: GGDEF domain-containing protein [Polyangiaceae bacterium]